MLKLAPVNYSCMFDDINELTKKRDIVREFKSNLDTTSSTKPKQCFDELFDISKVHNNKRVWFVKDLEKFFNRSLDVLPFFRPEFFIGAWDFNATEIDGEYCTYVTVCGLKKMLLILSLGELKS